MSEPQKLEKTETEAAEAEATEDAATEDAAAAAASKEAASKEAAAAEAAEAEAAEAEAAAAEAEATEATEDAATEAAEATEAFAAAARAAGAVASGAVEGVAAAITRVADTPNIKTTNIVELPKAKKAELVKIQQAFITDRKDGMNEDVYKLYIGSSDTPQGGFIDLLLDKDVVVDKVERYEAFKKLSDEMKTVVFDQIAPELHPYVNPVIIYNYSPKSVIYTLEMLNRPERLNKLNIDAYIAILKTTDPVKLHAAIEKAGLENWKQLEPDIMRAVPQSVINKLTGYEEYINALHSRYRISYYATNYLLVILFIAIVMISNIISYNVTKAIFSLITPANMKSAYALSVSKIKPGINWGREDDVPEDEDIEDNEEETETLEDEEPVANPRVTKASLFIFFFMQAGIGAALIYGLHYIIFKTGLLNYPRMRQIEFSTLVGLYAIYQVGLFMITSIGYFYETVDDNLGPLIFGFPKSMLFSCDTPDIDKEILYHYLLFCGYFMVTLMVLYIVLPLVIVGQFQLQGRELSSGN